MTAYLDLAWATAVALALPAHLPGQSDTHSDSWPDYRGPLWNGHAPNSNPPLDWSEKRNVTWKTEIHGRGWSSPIVQDGRVWVTTAPRNGRTMSVVAVDLETGKKLIDRVVFTNENPEHVNALNSYASPSPTSEPGRVYVHFGTYGTACIDTETGDTLWQRRDINCNHMEGPGSSPVLVDDLLIFNVDGTDVQYVIALDKTTGKTRWKRPRSVDFGRLPPDLRKAYSTPILIEVDGKRQLVSSGAQATMGYDPTTGKELWRLRYRGFSMSSRPLFGHGLVFLSTGFMSPRFYAFRPQTGEVPQGNVVWVARRSVPTMPSALLIDDLLYMVNDKGIVTCYEAETGKTVWRRRFDGNHSASPIYAAGRIYFFDREGRTVVVAAGRKFRPLGTNNLADGFMASPAVVGDALLLRTETHLYRIEKK